MKIIIPSVDGPANLEGGARLRLRSTKHHAAAWMVLITVALGISVAPLATPGLHSQIGISPLSTPVSAQERPDWQRVPPSGSQG